MSDEKVLYWAWSAEYPEEGAAVYEGDSVAEIIAQAGEALGAEVIVKPVTADEVEKLRARNEVLEQHAREMRLLLYPVAFAEILPPNFAKRAHEVLGKFFGKRGLNSEAESEIEKLRTRLHGAAIMLKQSEGRVARARKNAAEVRDLLVRTVGELLVYAPPGSEAARRAEMLIEYYTTKDDLADCACEPGQNRESCSECGGMGVVQADIHRGWFKVPKDGER